MFHHICSGLRAKDTRKLNVVGQQMLTDRMTRGPKMPTSQNKKIDDAKNVMRFCLLTVIDKSMSKMGRVEIGLNHTMNITLGMDYREVVFVQDLCESTGRVQFLFVIAFVYLLKIYLGKTLENHLDTLHDLRQSVQNLFQLRANFSTSEDGARSQNL